MSLTTPLFSWPMIVPFQDIDAAGIVFFARIFDYFHDAYVACLDARGISLPAVMAHGEWGAPLAHAEADYTRPMRFGDRVRAEITAADIGQTSLTVHHRIVTDDADAKLVCTGKTVHVFIDRKTFRPRAVPDEVRAGFSVQAPANAA